jgi:hypothetical protein
MKSCLKKLAGRRSFVFLVILALPIVMGQAECNAPSNITCQQNVSFSIERGKCTIVYPPCSNFNPWQLGDTYTLSSGFSDYNDSSSNIHLYEYFSDRTTLRKICSSEFASVGTLAGGYDYSFQTALGRGNVSIVVFDEGLFSVRASTCQSCRHIRSSWSTSVYAGVSGGTQPYSYMFTANGVAIPADPTFLTSVFDRPTRNTEYKVTVTDSTGLQATDSAIVFVLDNLNQPRPSVAVSPSGTVSINQPVTLTPSGGGAGAIVQWQWDFDWQGNDGEPFEQTINGSDGTTTTQWITGGTKYIRVRARDAQGNFGEAFVLIRVQ